MNVDLLGQKYASSIITCLPIMSYSLSFDVYPNRWYIPPHTELYGYLIAIRLNILLSVLIEAKWSSFRKMERTRKVGSG